MGLNFRKSFKVAPGVKVNFGKRSRGVSVGGKYGGFSINNKTGVTGRTSLPGTGISYTKKLTAKKNKATKKTAKNLQPNFSNMNLQPNAPQSPKKPKWYTRTGWIIFFLIMFPPIGITMMWAFKKDSWSSKRRGILTAAFTFWFLIALISGGSDTPDNTIETGSETILETESETIFEKKPETELESQIDTEAETQSESEAETELQAETETEIESETETETQKKVIEETEPPEEMVWISASGSRYHCKPSCSNMKNPSEVTKSYAESLNLTPCKKCY